MAPISAVDQLEDAENGAAGRIAPPVVKGIPIKAGPGVLGARSSLRAARGARAIGARQLEPPPISVPAMLLDADEQRVLNYQTAVWCFAFLDILSTILNIIAAYADGLPWEWPQLFVVLLILLGPICGMMGASYLQRHLTAVFVLTCLIKAVVQVYLAFASFFLWTILFAFLQCWITKIAATFWSALGLLTPERRRKVLEVKDYETQRVYW
ncbi:Kinesin-like protein KIF6 [Durusdinium trenchii]|uniref:Kinesin-like protein KIF6 n=1 Tax=Durusdinium trenchii TaxID=1381693 RepID=A0ABP0HYL7_9DINO